METILKIVNSMISILYPKSSLESTIVGNILTKSSLTINLKLLRLHANITHAIVIVCHLLSL